ncbi:hypothetical protein [Sediminispirochaeta bajacaliforniensis]|uniref:hypothetical protein n=1 Tax=Sediminispirochaeta bajacaliforniensis TaxID=148 RepID=UPI000378F629|nr:hypothetical protein [Sediminispirochaeta bajacaliforniensis]
MNSLNSLHDEFIQKLPDAIPADLLFKACSQNFWGEELETICGELADTLNADCSREDFYLWDYDHLEFIIEQARRFHFSLPKNFVNGLPQQFVLRIEADHLYAPECRN